MTQKIWTQADVDAWDKTKPFPQGTTFGGNCHFGDYGRFGANCSFGECCHFGNCCRYGGNCHFGDGCILGASCSFGAGCIFRDGCSFGNYCDFGACCYFGASCTFEGTHKAKLGYPFLSIAGAGSANRTTYFFNCEDGIWVRSGCFFGSLATFRGKVRAHDREHASTPSIKTLQYLGMANIVAATWDRTQIEN